MLELINEARSEYMLQESLYLDEGDGYAQEAPPPPYPSRAPPPQPPALAKYHIYNDPLEFADMDQIAISVRPHHGILSAPDPLASHLPSRRDEILRCTFYRKYLESTIVFCIITFYLVYHAV